MARRYFGIAREIELAEMAALPPFAQVIADMGGLGSVGACRGGLCVHDGNLSCEFHAFHYVRGNRMADRAAPSSPSKEMTMTTPSRNLPSAAAVPWMLNLAIRMLARILNMPEPLVHTTGVIVFAHVQTIENSVGRTLCPIRLLRRLRNRLRRLAC